MQPNDQQITKISLRSSYETITHSWLIDKIDFIPCIVHIENINWFRKETSLLPAKGCTILSLPWRDWPLDREGSLSYKGPRFLRSQPKDCDDVVTFFDRQARSYSNLDPNWTYGACSMYTTHILYGCPCMNMLTGVWDTGYWYFVVFMSFPRGPIAHL